jgi:hypothetical protein
MDLKHVPENIGPNFRWFEYSTPYSLEPGEYKQMKVFINIAWQLY